MEYIPLMLLIIYVGAVAILFLFVIMMLNVKIAEMKENSFYLVPITVIFAFLFIFQTNIILHVNFFSYNSYFFDFNKDFLFSFNNTINSIHFYQKISNIKIVSIIIFTEYYSMLLVISLILLLGLISTITLSLQKKNLLKSQTISSQVLRNYNNQLVFYN